VAILVIVLSVMTGFDNMWRTKILSFRPHLTVVSIQGAIDDEEELCRIIESVPGVKGVAPVIMTRTLIQHDKKMAAPIVLGMDPVRARNISRIPEFVMPGGKFDIEGQNAIIGLELAYDLNMRVGSKALIHSPRSVMTRDEVYLPEEVKIAGIFNMGLQKFDDGYLITSLETARNLVGLDKGVHAVYVMTDDPFRFEEHAKAVRRAIPPFHRVITWKEEDSVLFAALSNEKTMMFILLVFITIVAIFCVTNTLIVITVQKTREIGLLKALGFPSGRIMAAFVWHGWIQCIIGDLLGIGTGLLILNNLERIVRALTRINIHVFPKEIYGLDKIPWAISWVELVWISVFVVVFCTISSILPAYRAARMDPVQALRHE
jgi:lipoprotein-releasing system permease protein